MARVTERVVLILLAVFLLVTVGYQVYLSLYGGTKTETIYEYAVARAIPVEGIAVRSETIIDGVYPGIVNYLFEDGERVSIGESVAEFSESDRSDRNLRRLRELEQELKMLESAREVGENNFTLADMLNRDIKEQLTNLTLSSVQNKYSSMPDVRDKLTELINKKQVATGLAKSFTPLVNELTLELANLSEQEKDNATLNATAPVSGYFVKTVDGYEAGVSPKIVEEYTVADFLKLLDGDAPEYGQNAAGKIVRSQNWVFAAAASKTALEFVKLGQMLEITFEDAGGSIPATVSKILQDKDEERTVLVLACNHVSGPLLGLRKGDATLTFSQYNGLRVDMAHVRFMGEARGVYVLEDGVARFKELKPVYEDKDFILSEFLPPSSINPEDERYVKLFDQIITKGKDLYDGKTIQ